MENPEFVIPVRIGPYFFGELIGSGCTSKVFRVVHDYTTDEFCCKVISKKYFVRSATIKHFYSELLNLSSCQHKNIVQIIDILQDAVNFYIIIEFCNKGSLDKLIYANGKVEEETAKTVFSQIIQALHYLHQNGIAHRDIKAENVLMCEDSTVKLGDFGFSSSSSYKMLSTFCGTIAYCSPEVLSNVPYDGEKADMWSTGILLYVLVTGRFPWTVKSQSAIAEQVKTGYIGKPIGVTEECADLIQKLTCFDPRLRPTCSEVLSHKWLRIETKGDFFAPLKSSSLPRKLTSIFEVTDTIKFRQIEWTKSMDMGYQTNIKNVLKMCCRNPPKKRLPTKPTSLNCLPIFPLQKRLIVGNFSNI